MRKTQKVAYQQADTTKHVRVQYIGGLFRGAVSVIPVPTEKQLSVYSHSCVGNTQNNTDVFKANENSPNNWYNKTKIKKQLNS